MGSETAGPRAPVWGFQNCAFMLFGMIALMLLAGYVSVRITVARSTSETPPELVKASYSEEERIVADSRLDSLNMGETETFTPRELTVLVQRYLDKFIPDIGAVFTCEPTADGGVSSHYVQPLRDAFFFSGRSQVLEIAGKGRVEKGKTAEVVIASYRMADEAGENLDEKEAKRVFRNIEMYAVSLNNNFSKLEFLEVKDGTVTIRFRVD